MLRLLLPTFIFCLFFTFSISAQTERDAVEDILERLAQVKEDTTKVNLLNDLAKEYLAKDLDKSVENAREAIRLAQKINFFEGLSTGYLNIAKGFYYQYALDSILFYYEKNLALNNKVSRWENASVFDNMVGLVFHIQSDYSKAISYYKKSLNVRLVYNDKKGAAYCYNNIGAAFYDQGNYEKALDNYFKGLAIIEEIADSLMMSTTLANIGGIYEQQEKLDNALTYYNKSNNIATQINDQKRMADTYRNIGGIYHEKKQYDSMLLVYDKSLKLYQEIDNVRGEVIMYNRFGQLYLAIEQAKGEILKRYPDAQKKSMEFYKRSLEINNRELDEENEKIVSYSGLGEVLIQGKKYSQAIVYLQKALEMAMNIESLDNIVLIHKHLSLAYSSVGNYKKAYENLQLYKSLGDTLKNDENVELLTQMSMQHEFDKQQKEQEFQQAQRELRYQQKQKRDRLIRYFIIIVLVIVSGFSIQILRSYQRKKKDNLLLAKQKAEITKQKEEITDSIRYAKRIQTAILPSNEFANEILPEHFILFRPRDIVSGDYYWMNKIDNKVIIAAADCTGHGVPGAFMSMLGVSFLNEIVNKNNQSEPHLILNQLRAQVKRTLGQTGKEGEAKDGMDIAICVIDFDKMKMCYSGAYNPLYLYRNGELHETKADKMPIGIYIREKESFTNHEIDLQKGDTFYIFSDGYADQFGGTNGSKFKTKPFKAFLANIQPMTMAEQREALNKNIDEWRGDIEQIDDIIVLGVRV